MKQKAFSIIFKELPLNQIKQIFLEGESPTLRILVLTYIKIFVTTTLTSIPPEIMRKLEIH